ncbi:MAG: hypothetical protein ABR981_04500 [Candidatus Micrarchaeaceae archaeon]|jgi:hypothetical protein
MATRTVSPKRNIIVERETAGEVRSRGMLKREKFIDKKKYKKLVGMLREIYSNGSGFLSELGEPDKIGGDRYNLDGVLGKVGRRDSVTEDAYEDVSEIHEKLFPQIRRK